MAILKLMQDAHVEFKSGKVCRPIHRIFAICKHLKITAEMNNANLCRNLSFKFSIGSQGPLSPLRIANYGNGVIIECHAELQFMHAWRCCGEFARLVYVRNLKIYNSRYSYRGKIKHK